MSSERVGSGGRTRLCVQSCTSQNGSDAVKETQLCLPHNALQLNTLHPQPTRPKPAQAHSARLLDVAVVFLASPLLPNRRGRGLGPVVADLRDVDVERCQEVLGG